MSAEPNLDLYTTAAQVLPVLLAVIVFELRGSVIRDETPLPASVAGYLQIVAPVLVVALLVTGEAAAVSVLVEGEPNPAARSAVTTAFFRGRACPRT